ncbi:uncharacterized protein LOC117175526 [Belonocnema kinseyi]|uniref:uncharacterized protein LOC117175526 n=1 Tax=Belonocnema kinseyi TaxID=2817044 RepID=UPI00143DA38D|nr:uncharacterized protein LOC117175526 [Belonocnema kinseyi]
MQIDHGSTMEMEEPEENIVESYSVEEDTPALDDVLIRGGVRDSNKEDCNESEYEVSALLSLENSSEDTGKILSATIDDGGALLNSSDFNVLPRDQVLLMKN